MCYCQLKPNGVHCQESKLKNVTDLNILFLQTYSIEYDAILEYPYTVPLLWLFVLQPLTWQNKYFFQGHMLVIYLID
jgi:hypothetical protein